MRKVVKLITSNSKRFTIKKKLSTKKRKRLTVTAIKNAIYLNHTYPSDIARFFGRSRQYVAKFCKKLVKEGILEEDVREGNGKVAVYYKIVKPRVNQTSIGDWVLSTKPSLQYFRDGTLISYGILNYDEWFKPEKEWELGKTLMKGITIDDVFVRIANDKTLTFILPKIYGKDEVEPITKADYKAYQMKEKFLKMYPDFELTPMPINMKLGSLGTTRLSDVLQEYSGIKTDSFVIDSTPNKGSLEMGIVDPIKTSENMRDTVDFFATGGVKSILHELQSLNSLMAGFVERNVAIENAILLIAQTLKRLEERG